MFGVILVCVFILPSFGLFVVYGTVVSLGVVDMFVFLFICYYILGWAWFETGFVLLLYCCRFRLVLSVLRLVACTLYGYGAYNSVV